MPRINTAKLSPSVGGPLFGTQCTMASHNRAECDRLVHLNYQNSAQIRMFGLRSNLNVFNKLHSDKNGAYACTQAERMILDTAAISDSRVAVFELHYFR